MLEPRCFLMPGPRKYGLLLSLYRRWGWWRHQRYRYKRRSGFDAGPWQIELEEIHKGQNGQIRFFEMAQKQSQQVRYPLEPSGVRSVSLIAPVLPSYTDHR